MPRSREILLPWTSQPQEAVELNQEFHSVLPVLAAIPGQPDIVSGVTPVQSGTFTQTVGPQGIEYKGPSSQIAGKYSYAVNLPASYVATWLVIARCVSSGAGGANGLESYSANSSEAHWIGIEQGYAGFASTSNYTTKQAADTSEFAVYVGVKRRAGNKNEIWRNGVLLASTATGARDISAITEIAVGRFFVNLENNETALMVYWQDDLPAFLLSKLTSPAAAWSLFAPQTIWVPVSAGGGGATDLIIQEALHSHTADNIGLTLDTFLSVQEALHSHAADNLVLSVTGSTDLTVQETLHSHTSDNLALTLDTFLLLQDALHAHAADNITLSTGAVADLVIQEALHAHTADALVLTLDTFLVIQEAAHAHGADNIAFTLDSLLAVQEALHGHLADNLILSIPGSALSDAEFRQMYDWISELHLVHGLRAGSPLTVTPTTRAAGIVDQTIGEVGTTVTVTRI